MLFSSHPRGHRLGVKFVSIIYGSGIRSRPSGSSIVRSLALVRSYLGLFSFVPTFIFSYFILLYYYDSCVCFFLLIHNYCSHALGILCGIHTSCIWSPFPVVHGRWSLIFWSLRIMLVTWKKTALNLLEIILIICTSCNKLAFQ